MRIKNNKDFIKKINILTDNKIKYFSEYKKSSSKIIVKDEYGYHKIRPNSLLAGNILSLKSALFKENYLMNKLAKYNIFIKNREYLIIKYIDNSTILIKTKYGICKTSYGNLKRGDRLTISSALNKNNYALREFEIKHGSKYIIKDFHFVNAKEIFKVKCIKHKVLFNINYDEFKKRGCPNCGNESGKKYTKIDFFERYYSKFLTSIYTYENFEYIDSHTKSYITCLKHGDFPQTPNNHYNGQGCPICANEFKVGSIKWWYNTKGKVGILYIIKCHNDNEEFLKIGITSQTVEKRYRKKKLMPYNYEIIKEYEYSNKEIPFLLEKHLLEKFKDKKYTPSIPFGGSKKECFKIEIGTVEKEIEKWLN